MIATQLLYLVAKIKDMIIGWVALSPISSRFVYQGNGVGFKLLSTLVEESEKNVF